MHPATRKIVLGRQTRGLFRATKWLGEQDHYNVLNIPRNATEQQIKKAYRAMAKKYHPDAGPKGDSAMFGKVTDAYKTLSDTQKRQAFDMKNNGGGYAGAAGAGAGSNFNAQHQGFPGWENMEFAHTNSGSQHSAKMGQDLGNMWDELFGNENRGTKARMEKYQPERGADVTVKLALNFDEAVDGVTKEVSYFYQRKCVPCRGTGSKDGAPITKCTVCHGRGKQTKSNGYYHVEQSCTACGGSGKILRELCASCAGKGTTKDRTTQQVKVPAGVDTKDRLRVAGKGEAGVRGGAPGNLFIDVIVDNATVFTRDGEDIHLIQPISLTTAIIGGKITIPTVSGDITVTVPPGTQQGDKVLVRGKGIKKPQQNSVGHMYLHYHIDIPKTINDKQRIALEHFAEEEAADASQAGVASMKNMIKVKHKYNRMIQFKDSI
eukprot:TRINITY_DN1809_c1_g5_i1.p1 TRINITY_DN1809_c1_g5~~TRINITY_DN1809_c1_g5_i1.p1  ORF type:complete len:470 (+),score=87.29 TRINITY_DN1809_c1_g5_i1:109-1410(+)